MQKEVEEQLPRLLTLDEVSRLVKRSKRSLQMDADLGRLELTRIGRSVRVTQEAYHNYIEACRVRQERTAS